MFKYPLYDFFMMERLEMDPLVPTFGWWKDPEPVRVLQTPKQRLHNKRKSLIIPGSNLQSLYI
jgi:hypothetical protein